ncbi:MAG: cysteine desulfurase NifS [Candidatus Marinimicrobia bacterium]|nr:cysteine desulfurase NifS [Candidatus Neomarinimicrobiota bacterium]
MIYFDSAATTPVDKEVVKYMSEILENVYGNPSSIHKLGQNAKAVIEKSRRKVAQSINANSGEIYFTGGGTESNNLVLRGVLKKGDHFITSSVEHPAILKTLEYLESLGISSTVLKPNQFGQISLESIQNSIQYNTKLISIMYVNNELGTTNDIKNIGEFLNTKNIYFHTDAVQAVGKKSINLEQLKVDFLSASAHKFYGPKGIGILYVRDKNKLNPLITGGGQERNLRSGTENISGIAGMGLALEIATKNLIFHNRHIIKLENQLLSELNSLKINYRRNGINQICGLCNITFFDVPGQSLIVNLDLQGIAISYGAACASGSTKPSEIYNEIGIPKNEAECTIRISIGRFNSSKEITKLISALNQIIPKIKREPINA